METQSLAISVDDSYLSLLLTAPTHPQNGLQHHQSIMSDDDYAQQLQLQEAIMASLLSAAQIPHTPINEPPPTTSKTDAGETSQTLCEICADRKDGDQMFSVPNCSHRFCTECITKYISIKIEKRSIVHCEEEARSLITCPGAVDCEGVLEIEACRGIVGNDVLAAWDDVICESMIAPSQRFYCPYNNCSGLLVNDGGGAIREAECPLCGRLMCVRCNAPWHSGFECEEFSKLREDERERDDLMVHELAKQKKWQRCPKCKFFVEKNQGCLHITCRCGFQFCYACGAVWSSNHGGCRR